jgi:hypothetical protein
LTRYELPGYSDPLGLKVAVRASLDFLDVAPDRITVPLLAGVAREPLGDIDLSEFLHGRTGVFKSELAALAQQHFGPGLDAQHLPANWSSTANSLEEMAFLAKDTVLVVDDFVPHGSAREVADMHAKAERLFRAVGNHSGRGRMTREATLRPVRPPRALIIGTGEDLPRGHSVRARLLAVEVGPDDVDVERLTRCQADAASGKYACAMAGYIRWLAPRRADISAIRQSKVGDIRAVLREGGGHSRTADIVAQLAWAWGVWLDFAVDTGAITDDERSGYEERGINALVEALGAQSAIHHDADPVDRFWDLLSAAITSGHAHVAERTHEAPHQLAAWGWRRRDDGEIWDPRGDRIGWLDEDRGDLYLDPGAAFLVAESAARRVGDGLGLSRSTLARRKNERGLLRSTGNKRQTTTVRRTIGDRRVEVWHLSPEVLGVGVPEDDEPPDRPGGGGQDEPANPTTGEREPDHGGNNPTRSSSDGPATASNRGSDGRVPLTNGQVVAGYPTTDSVTPTSPNAGNGQVGQVIDTHRESEESTSPSPPSDRPSLHPVPSTPGKPDQPDQPDREVTWDWEDV